MIQVDTDLGRAVKAHESDFRGIIADLREKKLVPKEIKPDAPIDELLASLSNGVQVTKFQRGPLIYGRDAVGPDKARLGVLSKGDLSKGVLPTYLIVMYSIAPNGSPVYLGNDLEVNNVAL